VFNFKIRININSTNDSHYIYQKKFTGNPQVLIGHNIEAPNYTIAFAYAHEDTLYYQANLDQEQLEDFLFFVIKEEWTCLST
jgi:hypothetical protein